MTVPKTCSDVGLRPLLYLGFVRKYGAKYNVDPYLMLAYAYHESRFDPNAVNIGCKKSNPTTYWKKCTMGLMQAPPQYYKCPKCNNALCNTTKACADGLFDPEYNIMLVTEMFGKLITKFGNEYAGMVAGHWGYGNYTTHWKKYGNSRYDLIPQARISYVDSIFKLRDVYKKCLGSIPSPPDLMASSSAPVWIGGMMILGTLLWYMLKR